MKSRRLLKSRKGVRLVYHSSYCHYCKIYGGLFSRVHHIPWGTLGYQPTIINKIFSLVDADIWCAWCGTSCRKLSHFHAWVEPLCCTKGVVFLCTLLQFSWERNWLELMLKWCWFCSIELCATSYSSTKPRAGYWSNLGLFDFLEKGDKVAVDIGCKIKCLLKRDSSPCQQKEPQISFDMQTFHLYFVQAYICFMFERD